MAKKKIQTTIHEKETPKKVSSKGWNIGCFFGFHAYENGVCKYCGKKR